MDMPKRYGYYSITFKILRRWGTVVGKPDPEAIEIPKAFIVLRPEYKNEVAAEEIIEWSEKVPQHKKE
jgi:acyl-CoA synthetase (AMP-forming)/AMP-acid ligase II